MKTTWRVLGVLLFVGMMITGFAVGQVPQLINYQGVLVDLATGQPVPDDTYTITFSIYNVSSGGSAIWSENQSVQIKDGFYSTLLGSTIPLTPTILSGTEKYLGIKVGDDQEMTPRKRIVSVAYAYTAASVSGASNIFPSDGNVGIGDISPTNKLDVAGKIGINDTQVLFLPDQNIFAGTLFLGDGGGSLIHGSGIDGLYNTAMGMRALYALTTGRYNTASGHLALYSNTTGSSNTASGNSTLNFNTTGNYNTASGDLALFSNTEGNYNTAFGFNADVSSGILENATAIGYQAKVNASNKVVIGNTDVTVIGGYANWSNLSDSRFKRELREDVKGLDFITRLRPVSYKLDIPALNAHLGVESKADHKYVSNSNKGDIVYSGFIGQEVEAAAREVGYDFSGVVPPQNEKDHYSLRYAEFVVPLVKAVQEQQKMIEEMQNEIAALKKRLGE